MNTVLFKECNPTCNKLHKLSTKEGCALALATKEEGCALALSTKEGCGLALATKEGCVAQGMQPYVQQTFTLELFQPQKAAL